MTLEALIEDLAKIAAGVDEDSAETIRLAIERLINQDLALWDAAAEDDARAGY